MFGSGTIILVLIIVSSLLPRVGRQRKADSVKAAGPPGG